MKSPVSFFPQSLLTPREPLPSPTPGSTLPSAWVQHTLAHTGKRLQAPQVGRMAAIGWRDGNEIKHEDGGWKRKPGREATPSGHCCRMARARTHVHAQGGIVAPPLLLSALVTKSRGTKRKVVCHHWRPLKTPHHPHLSKQFLNRSQQRREVHVCDLRGLGVRQAGRW